MITITEDLIQKFFNNQCSAEEAKAVSRYLKKYPEELEKYMPSSGWNQFREQNLLSAADTKRILGHIKYSITYKNLIKPARNWALWYKVASVLLMACIISALIFRYRTFKQKESAPSSKQNVFPEVVETNNLNTLKKIWLSDSTEVTLHPGSRLTYLKGFEFNKREVRLEGHAKFTVTKDRVRPFTVYAGGLATTVLGTVFEVMAAGKEAYTRVRLISGSVLVNTDKDAGILHIAPVYLKPGEELQVNRATSIARTIKAKKPAEDIQRLANSSSPAKQLVPRGELILNDSIASFNHVPVMNVLETLQKEYSLNIKYDAHLLDNMFFTGNFKRTSGLPDEVIGAIALLNGLKVEQIINGYQLSK
ncbi:FecR family protein [bacterium A37T11]|nr:FecR family protein [bacterium A37T11]